ncbi:MAG: hypothetical protein NWF06_11860 [Candidatus Bathyarchaeota archaeon]|nr:hypothetical protein [Candidatus Bathyarchaeum sp.]
MIQEENVQTLMDLGLTLLQSKVYLALCRTGTATVKTIYNASNVARQDIYRIMPTLQELGLAEKVLSAPTMYNPTSLKEGYTLLLQNKSSEHIAIKKKTMELIESLNESNHKTTLQNDDSQFVITSSKNLFLKRLREGAERAQISIDRCGKRGIRNMLLNPDNVSFYKSVLKRGVRIRVLTEPDESKLIQEHIQIFNKNPLFEVRYLPHARPIGTVIYDGKEVNLNLTTPTNNTALPSLWTNNTQVVKIVIAYFEELWAKSK